VHPATVQSTKVRWLSSAAVFASVGPATSMMALITVAGDVWMPVTVKGKSRRFLRRRRAMDGVGRVPPLAADARRPRQHAAAFPVANGRGRDTALRREIADGHSSP
jgi:hypothetical protein